MTSKIQRGRSSSNSSTKHKREAQDGLKPEFNNYGQNPNYQVVPVHSMRPMMDQPQFHHSQGRQQQQTGGSSSTQGKRILSGKLQR